MKGKILALILCGCLAITGMTACSSNPDNNNSATDENAVDDDRKPTKTPADGNEGSTVSPTGGAGGFALCRLSPLSGRGSVP